MDWLATLWKKLTEPASESSGIDGSDPLRDFTPRAQVVVELAHKEAARLKHPSTDAEHLLLALIELRQGVAYTVLQRVSVDLEAARREVERCVPAGDESGPILAVQLGAGLKKVFACARRESQQLRHTYIGTEHLLLGLLADPGSGAARLLNQLHVERERTRQEIVRELDPYFPADAEAQEPSP